MVTPSAWGQNVVLIIHGGAAADRSKVTPELRERIVAGLKGAIGAGFASYQKGDNSLTMVEKAIRELENNPDFNAGRGAVFTSAGRNELDASIMDGKTLRAGAVAGVTRVKNPISAARAVMEKSKHVLLVSEGANTFAKEAGLEMVSPSYFKTPDRWKEHLELRDKEKQKNKDKEKGKASLYSVPSKAEWSTVGAVARDREGNLAAGTSTGGMAEKRWGRVGDSPIIGAGTYADNAACGVSCTGHGEYFIRYAVSHDIVSLMKYRGVTVQEAADEVVQRKLKPAGGSGAVIALDRQGNVAASYNSEGLFRAFVTQDGHITVKLFDE